VRGGILLIQRIYVGKVHTPIMRALPQTSIHMRCRLHMERKFCGRCVPAWTIWWKRSEF
jgi:hypothetical protein